MKITYISAVLAGLAITAAPAQTPPTVVSSTVAPTAERTLVDIDLAALIAACSRNGGSACELAVINSFAAFMLQNPTPSQINNEIGFVAAALIET